MTSVCVKLSRTPRSYLPILGLLSTLLMMSSCTEKPAEDYNQLPIQLLTQAFDAVHNGQHDLAATRLAKVQAEERTLINKLITREKEGAVLKAVGDLLEKGDFEGAAKVVEKGLVECGHTPQMTHARQVVDALRYVKSYKEKLPFKDPDQADSLVNGLPQPKLFANHIPYVKWLNQQKKNRDTLLQKVRREKAAGLMTELDALILRERGNYGVALKKLNTLIPDHPLYKSVTAGKAEENLSQEELELFRMIQFKRRPSLQWAMADTQPSKSLSGRYLMALHAIKNERHMAALAGLREIMEKEPQIDPILISEFIVYAKVTPESLSPSATSLMNTIYHFNK